MNEIETLFQDATQLFGIDRAELCGPSQRREVAEARHAVAWALRQRALTLACIGRLLGDRSYTTIINSCTRAEALARHDCDYALKLAGLRRAAPQIGAGVELPTSFCTNRSAERQDHGDD